jgi:outer membrane autotransporter protein
MFHINDLRRGKLAAAVCLTLAVSACGGGGGSRSNNVSSTPTTPANPTTPTTPVAPTTPTTPTTPTAPVSTEPPLDAQLSLTNTHVAHAAGFTGAGVAIAIVDTGVMRNHPALAGRVTDELIFVDATANNTAIDDVVGHGTSVAEIAAGTAFDRFAGGVASSSTIVSARIINDKTPTDDGSGNGNRVTSADPLGAINDALIARNVKVSNNSWGGLYWDSTSTGTTQSFHDAYDRYINTYGGLVVFAAGNSGLANPSDVAALPSRAADLEKGWLAVVALSSNAPTTLASYSNKCGEAMNYCLAAPGDVIVSGQNDTASTQSYYIYQGTSLAAPQVTGAAAVVWSVFPYFTNDNVRQTILGTADDLGAAGPDTTFGYGALNVGRAVGGPAKFDWGDFTVNLGSSTSTWTNPISGVGGLVVSGNTDSSLNLASANNTYLGLTHVMSGRLNATGPIPGNLQIDATGIAGVGSRVSGSVTNSGTFVQTGNVTVGGNYAQTAGGSLSQYIGGVLTVDGSASLAGNFNAAGAVSGYVGTAHQQVLTAAQGVTGTFASFTRASGVMLSTSLNYAANEVWLDTSRISVTRVAGMSTTAVTAGSAQRLESAFTRIDSALASPVTASTVSQQTLIGAAMIQQSSSAAAAQKSVASLSGQLHDASAQMTLQAIDAGNRALSDRFDEIADRKPVGAWTQTLGYRGGLSRPGYGNVGVDLAGWMVGNDHKLGANGIVGFAVSQSQGLGQLAEAVDQGRSHAVEAMAYVGVVGNRWYAMGRAGAGTYREDMRRALQLGDSSTMVASSSEGRYGVAYGETGMRLHAGGFGLTPYASVEYDQVNRGGFSETGGAGFGLTAGDERISRWQAGIGMRADRTWRFASGSTLSLDGHVAWQHAFATSGDVFSARYTGIGDTAPVGGIGLSQYGALFGTALNWSMSPRASLQLSLDKVAGQRDDSQTAMATYRLAF